MADRDGDFIVTMEHPSTDAPEPIVFEIGPDGVALQSGSSSGGKLTAAITAARGTTAPPTQRVGFGRHD
jgi:hypothetical protein